MGIADLFGDIGIGDVLQGAGVVASIFGSGKEKVNTTPTAGYETLPQYLKDAYEKVYFPKVMENFNKPFEMGPTVRYTEQDPLFRSQALSNYQALSDEVGGLFPEFKAPAQQEISQEVQQAASTIPAAPAAMMATGSMGNQMTQGSTGNPFFDRMGMGTRMDSIMGMVGKVNPYTGETVDAKAIASNLPVALQGGRGLMGVQQASGQLMTPEQKQAMDIVFGNMHAAEYDPEDNFIGKLLKAAKPLLVGAVLGPGLGAALGGMGLGTTAAQIGSKIGTGLVNRGVDNG